MSIAARERYVRERFDRLAGRFKPDVPAHDPRLAAVFDALGDVAGRRVLDLGCGKGRFSRHLRRAGANVVGLDPSPAMLAGAVGLSRIQASAARLPLADGGFDAVIAVEVFEHLADIDAALGEIHRVLRPGGLIVVVDKNRLSLNASRPWLPNAVVKAIDERRGRWMYPADGPIRERWFTAGGFARRLSRCFCNVHVRFPLMPEERRHVVFHLVPPGRLFIAWSGVKAGLR